MKKPIVGWMLSGYLKPLLVKNTRGLPLMTMGLLCLRSARSFGVHIDTPHWCQCRHGAGLCFWKIHFFAQHSSPQHKRELSASKPFKPPIYSSLLLGTQADACAHIDLQDSEGSCTGRTSHSISTRHNSASATASWWLKARPGEVTGFLGLGRRHPDSLFPEDQNN